MIFKVYDHNNRFLQYVSLCLNADRLSNENKILGYVRKSNIPKALEIDQCTILDAFNGKGIIVNCYIYGRLGIPFRLNLFLSETLIEAISFAL